MRVRRVIRNITSSTFRASCHRRRTHWPTFPIEREREREREWLCAENAFAEQREGERERERERVHEFAPISVGVWSRCLKMSRMIWSDSAIDRRSLFFFFYLGTILNFFEQRNNETRWLVCLQSLESSLTFKYLYHDGFTSTIFWPSDADCYSVVFSFW